jgi:hypothetical protein
MSLHPLPTRQIHLDFHTGPWVPDVGRDFIPDEFARTLADAHVNSVTLFAKCHHGHLYYDTRRPERHPSLASDNHMLEAQVDACKRRGIRTPIYLSVQCDEWAANTYPDWVVLRADGLRGGRHKPFELSAFSWQCLDMSSPYVDFLGEQIDEVVRKFKPVDGIFLDMCWDQESSSHWAQTGQRKLGLDPTSEADRKKYALHVVHEYMRRYNEVIARANNNELPRVWYNSRPKLKLTEEAQYLKHVEIEALPTGGWGYTYFPLNVRFARNFGLPFIGMTARFHKSWSDFGGIKPEAALKYECCQMLAHGGGCSVGDQLHPRGTFERGSYELIGNVYKHVEACEPFCVGATPLTEIGVLRDVNGNYHTAPGDALEGVVRLLQQTFQQFDFTHANADDLHRFAVLIVPDGHAIDAQLSAKLIQLAARGTKVIVAGIDNAKSINANLQAIVGASAVASHDKQVVFLRYDRAVVTGVVDTDHVLYDPTCKLSPATGASSFGQIVEPYFDRTWQHFTGHNQTPPDSATNTFAATASARGALFGFDLFKQYATHGNQHIKRLFAAVMNAVLSKPLTRGEGLASHVELTLTRLGAKTVAHVLSFAPQRRTPGLDLVEEPTPLIDAPIRVRFDAKPARVTLQPGGVPMTYDYADGYATVQLTTARGHEMLVFE